MNPKSSGNIRVRNASSVQYWSRKHNYDHEAQHEYHQPAAVTNKHFTEMAISKVKTPCHLLWKSEAPCQESEYCPICTPGAMEILVSFRPWPNVICECTTSKCLFLTKPSGTTAKLLRWLSVIGKSQLSLLSKIHCWGKAQNYLSKSFFK